MKNELRLQELAKEADAIPAPRLNSLKAPEPLPAYGANFAEARRLLVANRTGAPDYKDETKGHRGLMLSKKEKERLRDTTKWKFSLDERREVLDANVRSFCSVGVAQALIELEADRLDFNVGASASLGERNKRNSKHKSYTIQHDLLVHAVQENRYEYATLLASRGARQKSLDQALAIALRNDSRNIIRELLRYGADPQTQATLFLDAVRERNTEVVTFCLRSPKKLRTLHLNNGLLEAVKNNYSILVASLVAHGADPDYKDAEPLRLAVAAGNFTITSLLLLAKPANNLHQASLETALATVASNITDRKRRFDFLELLLCAGAPPNVEPLQDELFRAVRADDVDTIALLVSHGTSADRNNAEAVQWAIRRLNFEALKLLLEAGVSRISVSKAVEYIPADASESDALEALHLLVNRGAKGGPWGQCLLTAVQYGHSFLAKLLIENGASIVHDGDVNAVKIALRDQNFAMFDILMRGELIGGEPSSLLSKAIPQAMELSSKTHRRQIVSRLLEKGASGHEVDVALQVATAETSEDRDPALVEILVRKGASTNYSDGKGNCLILATTRGDCGLLTVLWTSGDLSNRPSKELISEAIPLAFASRHQTGYANAVRMVGFLLDKFGKGTQDKRIDKLLVEAVLNDEGMAVLKLLVDHKADVNHQDGLAIEEALKAETEEAIEYICRHATINKKTSERVVPLALDHYTSRARPVLAASRQYPGILHKALINEVGRPDTREPVVKMLLEHGASVNANEGAALLDACHSAHASLVRLLVSYDPSTAALRSSFRASILLEDAQVRLDIMQLLLNCAGQRTIGQSEALIKESMEASVNGLDIVKLLVDHGADVNYYDGAALKAAISTNSLKALQLLLSRQPSEDSIFHAFENCLSLDSGARMMFSRALNIEKIPPQRLALHLDQAVQEGDHDLLELILESGGSPAFDGGKSLISATGNQDPVSLKLLLEKHADTSAMNRAFARMTEPKVIINSLEGLQCAQMLLESGVDARLRNGSLIKALESNTKGQLDDFVDLLLQHRPNVNIENGRCFVAAARLDNTIFFEKLLDPAHKPSGEIVPRALIKSVQRAEKLVQLLQLFFRCVNCAFLPGDNELIFLAFDYFPRSENIIKVLLDCGCPGGATQMKRIVDDIGLEPVTPLIWALQLQPKISDPVVQTLLELGQGAKPSYVTPKSRTTAAILAAKAKRYEILKRLLELGVDISFRDEKKRSALFYACNAGDLPSAMLMIGRVRPNDGSLHEAARGAHPEIVELLLANRNDPNVSFEGRSALAELCFRGRPDRDDWESRASEVIQLLLDSGTKLTRKYNNGKTILHLALDNPMPEAITSVLLDFPDICNQINEDIFLFENEAGLCYSPINYVENFYEGSNDGMRNTLIKLLKYKGCERRFFSKHGNHPKGYIGLPPALEERARRQSILDDDHYQDLRRLRERTMALMEIGDLQHTQNLRHSNETHEADLHRRSQLEAQQAEASQNRHLMGLAHRREVDADENRMTQTRQQLMLKHEAEAGVQRQRFQEADHAREFNHSSRMALLGHETLENKVNLQRKLLNEQESAATRQYNRNISFLDRQDRSARTQAEAMKSIQASNSSGGGQFRLGNGDEWGSVD